ncbi:MAG: hypothetical protein SF162_19755 [bacterium]|nr:hypothetical protein [bacterium]
MFRQIICDQLALTQAQASWAYLLPTASGKGRSLSLDARIDLNDVQDEVKRERLEDWLRSVTEAVGMNTAVAHALQGAVFEVRQGYKSKDSKRQNADIANAGTALMQGYLPVLVLMSAQMDTDLTLRYANAGWLILKGVPDASASRSTFAFCTQVLDYDLAAFFQRCSPVLAAEVRAVLVALLTPADTMPASTRSQELDLLELTDEIDADDPDGLDF